MFLETSYPRQPGDKARLESYNNPPTDGQCVEFMYHMFGAGMGTLNLYIRRAGKLDTRPVWTMTGDQGNQWYRGQVTVTESRSWNVSLLSSYLVKSMLRLIYTSTINYFD